MGFALSAYGLFFQFIEVISRLCFYFIDLSVERGTHTCGGRKTTSGDSSLLPPLWVMGIECLVADTSTHCWTVLPAPHWFGFEWKDEPRSFLPLRNLSSAAFVWFAWAKGNLCTSTIASSALMREGNATWASFLHYHALPCTLQLTHTLNGNLTYSLFLCAPFDLWSIHSGPDTDLVSTTPDLTQLAIGSPSLHPSPCPYFISFTVMRSHIRDWIC